MFDFLLTPEGMIALLTLSTLEIVLGVDNLVFISIVVSRLPAEQRSRARRFGIALACISRILLLLTLAYLARMTEPLFSVAGLDISVRDLVLILGGLFLLVKSTMEIHEAVEGGENDGTPGSRARTSFAMAITQIAIIDLVFSLDSVITAVGMVNDIPIMVIAILMAVAVMLLAADLIGNFIDKHPTIKMLALTFLILVGAALVAEGLHLHVPRAYLYFAMAFSGGVEALNMVMRARHRRAQLARHEIRGGPGIDRPPPMDALLLHARDGAPGA